MKYRYRPVGVDAPDHHSARIDVPLQFLCHAEIGGAVEGRGSAGRSESLSDRGYAFVDVGLGLVEGYFLDVGVAESMESHRMAFVVHTAGKFGRFGRVQPDHEERCFRALPRQRRRSS